MSTHTFNRNHISTTTLIIISLFMLLLLASFNSNSPSLRSIGSLSMLFVLASSFCLMLFHFAKKKDIHESQFSILLTATAFLLIMFVGLTNSHSARSFETIIQFFTLISFFVFCTLIQWNANRIKIARKLAIAIIVILPFVANIPLIGAHIAFALFFVLLQRNKKTMNFILVTASLTLIYYTGARAVFILLLATLVTYVIWGFITRNKRRFISFFLLVSSGILSFIFIYPNIMYWTHYSAVNHFIIQYTGQTLLTGRNVIWSILTEIIYQKPLLGHGTGILPTNLSEVSKSSHNLYVQIALQNGLIALGVLFVLFLVIWNTFYKTKEDYTTRLSAAFFVGIIVYQSFEVVLTQNKPETALMFWFIISVGVSNAIYKSRDVRE